VDKENYKKSDGAKVEIAKWKRAGVEELETIKQTNIEKENAYNGALDIVNASITRVKDQVKDTHHTSNTALRKAIAAINTQIEANEKIIEDYKSQMQTSGDGNVDILIPENAVAVVSDAQIDSKCGPKFVSNVNDAIEKLENINISDSVLTLEFDDLPIIDKFKLENDVLTKCLEEINKKIGDLRKQAGGCRDSLDVEILALIKLRFDVVAARVDQEANFAKNRYKYRKLARKITNILEEGKMVDKTAKSTFKDQCDIEKANVEKEKRGKIVAINNTLRGYIDQLDKIIERIDVSIAANLELRKGLDEKEVVQTNDGGKDAKVQELDPKGTNRVFLENMMRKALPEGLTKETSLELGTSSECVPSASKEYEEKYNAKKKAHGLNEANRACWKSILRLLGQL